MKSDKNDKKLDELIGLAITRERPKLDFDKWKDSHEKEIENFNLQNRDTSKPVGQFNLWRTIMKSKLTKLVTVAAVVIIAMTINKVFFNDTSAWAQVIEALDRTNDVQFVLELTDNHGEVKRTSGIWIKNKVMLRAEHPGLTIIDDGVSRLSLDSENKKFELMDSARHIENPTRMFTLVRLFTGGEASFYEATELSDESNSEVLVYEVKERESQELYGKVWVEAQSSLPFKIVRSNEWGERLGMEVTIDYEPIPIERFNVDIPPGYVELPKRKCPTISGRVVDKDGNPISGAQILTPCGGDVLSGHSDENGNFLIKLQRPGNPYPASRLPLMPMILRAFKDDDPHHVAWTLIYEDYKESYSDVQLEIRDEEALLRGLWGDPGEIIYQQSNDSNVPFELKDVILQMGPASVITGRVTTEPGILPGKPIANAKVTVNMIQIRLGRNRINIRHLGNASGENKTFAITDEDGYYVFSNLPSILANKGSEFELSVEATGYATEEKEFSQEKGCDFQLPKAGAVIRGILIDNYGQPLIGRGVGVEVEDDDREFDIDGVITDLEGKFELFNVPKVSGLMLGVGSNEIPYHWDDNPDTRNLEFVYYPEKRTVIDFDSGEGNEYWVEIVLDKPDITIEVTVKNSNGEPLENIPMGVSSYNSGKAEWYITKLSGITDMQGLCTISEVPQVETLELWFCKPRVCGGFDEYERKGKILEEFSKAVTESQKSYASMRVPIELEPGKKEYKVSVILFNN